MQTARGQADRTAIIILGMHRSGTSALSRVLGLLGCDLPKTLVGPNRGNETGHWESVPVYRLNDRILKSQGLIWDDWQEFPSGWFDSAEAEGFREEAMAILAGEFGTSRLFVLKDPRNCRLLPLWLDVLKRSGVRPLAFVPIRNPIEVGASLEARDGFDPAFGHLMWLRHVLDAEVTSRDIPRFFSTYDQLLESWRRVAADSQTTLRIEWPRLSDRAAGEIEDFLAEKHRHHRSKPESIVDNPALSSWLRETYSVLTSWVRAGEDPARYPQLDRIRRDFNAAAPAFSRLVAGGQQARRKVASLQASLSQNTEKLAVALASAAADGRRATQAEQLSRELGDRLAAAETAAIMREALAKREEAELARFRADLSKERRTVAALEAAHSDKIRQLAAREKDVADLMAARRELQRLAAARAESETMLSALRGQADSCRAETEKLRAEYARQSRAYADLQRAMQETADTTRRLKADAAAAAAAHAVERSKAAAEAERLRREKAEAERRGGEELACLRRERADLRESTKAQSAEITRLTYWAIEGERSAKAVKQLQFDAAKEMGRAIMTLLDSGIWRFAPRSLRIRQQMARLKRSGLFDAGWYLARYKDIAEAGIDPLRHYVEHGVHEGREPNPALAALRKAADGE